MEDEEPTPDRELTDEENSLINHLSQEEISEIDAALLNNVNSRWRKMAMVVGLTMTELPNRIKGIPDLFYAQRLRLMVENGQIEANGNLSSMRHCEVRT
ncbi:MAG: DUF3658 domain-containing protein [Gammaproteobacteria bacterium]|nr:DUF3658 domain-containing protein [Gammaproteobacteria bacterium]